MICMTSTINWCKLVPELIVSDFPTSLRFYVDLLGFTELYSRHRAGHDFVYLEFEGAQLMLESLTSDGWLVGEMAQPFGRGINFQIECSDANAIRERLVAAGVVLYREMDESWYDIGESLAGQREFLVQDPDGYLLRFAQNLGEKNKDG